MLQLVLRSNLLRFLLLEMERPFYLVDEQITAVCHLLVDYLVRHSREDFFDRLALRIEMPGYLEDDL